ncbi:hypothetical protein GmHk_18G052091 [Glycine max]|nr:hypothetical protein GmHk_18G052091 [Glycine max]
MLESFKQQEQMSVLELYIEKDVAGGSMFHSANSLTSCGNYLSNDETQPTINMSNLHIDEDDDGDDDDYLVSNSYVEESLDEDDSVDGISDTDDEVTNIPQPVRIVHPTEDTWKVTQWGGPHTCLNMTITQDHEKLDSDLIATCVVERINSEFAYKVSYKKAWLAKQKAIAIEYGDRDESYAKLGSIKSVVANEALGWQPPHGYHVYCVRHIASNFNRKFNNAKQKEMLKKLAYTPCKHIFDQNLEKFRAQRIENPFWNDALHYNNINWSYRDEEDICGLEMPSTFNVGQELYVGMEFDSKDAVKNAVKQYVIKVHQSFKVVESKSNKYVVCCLNKNAECPCPFYMRAILFKKTDTWKVTQWGGPHTCLNMTMTQDHEKLDSNLIATCVVGTMIREEPSIKISLIQERTNSEFVYKVSYKKAWLAK